MTDKIISDYAGEMISKPIPDNRGQRFYTRWPGHLMEKKVGDRFHVIFVAYYADPHILKKALTLKKSGKIFVTLVAGCIREDVRIEQYVDQAYEYKDFKEFYELCKVSSPFSWHAATPYYHSAIILYAGCDESRLVTDVVDAALFFYREKNNDMVDLESSIMKHSHAVVHKMPDEAWIILETEYDLKKKNLKYYAYPAPEFTFKSRQSVHPKTSPPRLVYAGGIIPYEIAVSRGHENHIFDDLIAMTGADTFDLTIYVNQNARDMPWHQHRHYYDLEKKYPFFHFKKGLPYHQIAQELSEYSAGIFYDNIKHSSYNPDHFRYNIATKLFTYIEAGLPIIMYEESECMADMVRENSIGEIYSINNEKTIIDAARRICDHSCSDNVDAFLKTYSADSYQEDLLRMYGII